MSAYRLATGWVVRVSKPGGGDIFKTGPGSYPTAYKMGNASLLGCKAAGAWP